MVTCLLHQRINSIYVSPSCQKPLSLKLQIVYTDGKCTG
jgi:hypothetical protein